MPRYLVETHPFAGDVSRLLTLVGVRFPEIALERRYALGGDLERDAWVCRAATDHQIRRFAIAAGIAVRAVSRIEADVSLTVDVGA
jgi:hypothetical protein